MGVRGLEDRLAFDEMIEGINRVRLVDAANGVGYEDPDVAHAQQAEEQSLRKRRRLYMPGGATLHSPQLQETGGRTSQALKP